MRIGLCELPPTKRDESYEHYQYSDRLSRSAVLPILSQCPALGLWMGRAKVGRGKQLNHGREHCEWSHSALARAIHTSLSPSTEDLIQNGTSPSSPFSVSMFNDLNKMIFPALKASLLAVKS